MRGCLAILVLVLLASPATGDSLHDIHKVIAARQGELEACFRDQLDRDPGLAAGGKVIVEFRIKLDGRTTRVRIGRKSTLRQVPLERCLLKVFRALQFPPREDPAEVSFPLIFAGPSTTAP